MITSTVSNITGTTADAGGNVISGGTAAVTARGVCWSTSADPTTANPHTSDGTGTGTFTSAITGLASGIAYYVRAYATNAVGTAYGSNVQSTTDPTLTVIVKWPLGTDSVSSSPAGIDCPGTCSETYDVNTPVTLNVTVDAASSFDCWSGDCAAFGCALSGAITTDGNRTCTATFGNQPTKGDPDGDGDQDVVDVLLCYRIAMGYLAGTAEQLDAADVDSDGDVDEDDALILSEYIIGVRTTLP